jgi:hypothetical protein
MLAMDLRRERWGALPPVLVVDSIVGSDCKRSVADHTRVALDTFVLPKPINNKTQHMKQTHIIGPAAYPGAKPGGICCIG